MSLNYKQAGFQVESLYKDSASNPTKTVALPNISWGGDFTVVKSEPTEASLLNVTGSDLTQFEKVRIGRQEVANIYANTESTNSAKLPDTRGVQVMVELKETYHAISDATGQVYDLPCVARMVVRVPYNPVTNKDLIADVALRCVAMLGQQSSDGETTAVQAARVAIDATAGDLTPATDAAAGAVTTE